MEQFKNFLIDIKQDLEFIQLKVQKIPEKTIYNKLSCKNQSLLKNINNKLEELERDIKNESDKHVNISIKREKNSKQIKKIK